MTSDPLDVLARAVGVAPVFRDQLMRDRAAPPESLRVILAALGLNVATDREARETLAGIEAERRARILPHWQVVEAGAFRPGADVWAVEMEDGAVVEGRAGAALILAPGYHRLCVGGQVSFLLAVPPRPPVPARCWGVTVPLYGLRTAAAGGVGDYADLAQAMGALGGLGAAFVGLNPIHAGFPDDPAAISPYSPSHRRRLSVMHIATGEGDPPGVPLIDYPGAWSRKKRALGLAYDDFRASGGDLAFEGWCASEGAALGEFAVHQALSEQFGPYWSDWPEELRRPGAPAVTNFAAAYPGRVAFHAWLQWRATSQLAAVARAGEAAGMAHGLYLDLAVGTHPHGAETWAEPTAFARGVSLGAPPDAFSADGQTWCLAPLSPRALVAQEFRPLIETLRAQLRHARLLRIDHILGFDRAFWVPDGAPGTYVAMPRAAMIAVARIEAHRAGAVIVGEDLGNIPEGLGAEMARGGLLGCRLAMFERDGDGTYRPPAGWDERALASFTTHDLPTYLGWRRGRDIDWRLRVGDIDARAAAQHHAERAADVARYDAETIGGDTDRMHAHLAGAASALVALTIEDILGVEEQPNLPGTIDEHPNWRRRLPVGPEQLGTDPAVRRAAALMHRAGR